MAVEIRVHKKFSARVDRARLRRVARRALNAEKVRGDLTVYVTTDSEIRLHNRRFHSTNAATDVLSFPSLGRGRAFTPALLQESLRTATHARQSPKSRRTEWECGASVPAHHGHKRLSTNWKSVALPPRGGYIGDIVISYDRARVQARAAQWRIADELDLLVVHGVLHLVGYDDLSPRTRAKMWNRQQEILSREVDN